MAHLALIVGPKQSPKTSCALSLAEALKERGVRIGGFLQEKRVEEDRKHYDLIHLTDDQRVTLATEGCHSATEDENFCSLAFQQESFDLAMDWLQQDSRTTDVIFVGDISKLEVSGKGHHDTVMQALGLDKVVLLCVRADQLFYVVEKYDLEDNALAVLELPADPTEQREFIAEASDQIVARVAGETT